MYGGLSISEGIKSQILAFVGTINSEYTRVFSSCNPITKGNPNISVKDLKGILVSWIENYYHFDYNKKVLPDTIILYIEGVSLQESEVRIKNM